MLNALTFDVEDYFHVHAFAGVIARDEWERMPRRVCASTRRILQLLREHRIRATFFVLGWVAERHPELVREIADDGHELASHGYAHETVDTLTREQYRGDVARSLEAIHAACPNVEIRGYRAPSFSINDNTPWAFDVLQELGFQYDSSISPVTFHDRYGMPHAPRFAHAVGTSLTESVKSMWWR
jgi:polysaccharide deacetylase family protein (PEP-CTERM system associated)